ncbi:MAG: cytochrome C, partial [Flavobacteriaceae bacterium]|nr:cytochrome C [Flavobacteriaceae bacterium]
FGNYSNRKQENKLDRIKKQIKKDEMPLKSYTLIHRNAILSTTQKREILNWITKIQDSLATEN